MPPFFSAALKSFSVQTWVMEQGISLRSNSCRINTGISFWYASKVASRSHSAPLCMKSS